MKENLQRTSTITVIIIDGTTLHNEYNLRKIWKWENKWFTLKISNCLSPTSTTYFTDPVGILRKLKPNSNKLAAFEACRLNVEGVWNL